MKIYPSILTDSLAEFEKQLSWATQQEEIEIVQVDIVDGFFADNLTLTPLDLTQLEYGQLKIDFHLMTEEPMNFVQELEGLSQYLPTRAVISQVERMSHQADFLETVKGNNWQSGLSLDLFTPVEAIDEESWLKTDIIQLMTIEAGFQGQKFNLHALEKIKTIQERAGDQVEIIIDGGVKLEHLSQLKKLDVAGVVVGSGLWQAPDHKKALSSYLSELD